LDTIKAVVQKVIREGKHGPFAVATSDQLEGSVTFSLEPTVWKEKEWPEEGMMVFLGELRQKRAGWRAKTGRFWKPSDEQTQQTERSKVMFENIEGVVVIGGNPYAKTPAALEALLAELRTIGYQIDNLREADYRKKDDVSVETMEKNGWSLWYAHLDVRRGKCGSCNQYIDTAGIRSHGHKCGWCGAVTYYKIIDGSTVRFSFVQRDENEYGMADLTMKARRWDTEAGYLYLYPEILDGLWLRGDRAKQYFEANKDKWEEVEEDGQRLIRVRYRNSSYLEDSAINPSNIHGHFWNHEIVLVWEGKEYPEYSSNFPIPRSMSVYEAWHWAPLDASPTLHKKVLGAIGNTDDKGWHYQDGRPWFGARSFEEMGKFVRHFTSLNADAWDVQSRHFRLDGPGGIDDVAKFCHPNAQVENRPNVGNLLVGFGKAMSGQKLTEGEMAAIVDAAKDPEERDKFFGTFKRRPKR
jgi:hypothetical protein